MASRRRRFASGAPAHLTSRSVAGLPLFPTTADCFEFLRLLAKVTTRIKWTIGAWCLMGTHYHLLVFTPEPDSAPLAMQILNSSYARYFNAAHDRRGHVFGARYTDTLVETERHLQAVFDYVLENPVRAGLVRTYSDWAWSGDGLLEPRPVRELVAPSSPNRDFLVRRRG